MKNRIKVYFALLIAFALFTSCQSKKSFEKDGGLQFIIKFENYSIDKFPQIDQILKDRLSFISKGDVDITRTSDGIIVKVPGVYENEKSRITELIKSNGNLGFWETYENKEISPYFEEVNKVLYSKLLPEIKQELKSDENDLLIEYPLYKYLAPNVNRTDSGVYFVAGPVIGTAFVSDTARVNKYLSYKDVRTILPNDLKLLWSAKAYESYDSVFQLIAIKISTRDKFAPLTGDAIVSARIDRSRSGGYEVNIQMENEGAKIWARFTEQNIGKSIAIVFDDLVYSYPNVMSSIKGGASQISGNFSKEEAEDLCALIKYKALPTQLTIINSEVVKKK